MRSKTLHAARPHPDDPPALTADWLARARPAREVVPTVVRALKAGKRGRGPQRTPTKVLVSIRLDREALETLKRTGKGWQTRLADKIARDAKRLTAAGER
jgi:uncharacterized protein (DUF4415 family)